MLAIMVVNRYFWSFFVLHYGAPSEKATKDIKSYLQHILYTTLYYRVQYTVCTHYSKYTAACAVHSTQQTVYSCTVYSTQCTICVHTVYLCTQLSMYLEHAACAQYYKLQYMYGSICRLDLHVRSKFRSRSTKFSRSLEIRNTKFSTRVQY